MQEKKLVLASVHTLYYEDYTTSFDQTVQDLANFLGQPMVRKPLPFVPGKTYGHLFSDDLKRKTARLVKQLATPKCWKLLKRYFQGILDPTEMKSKMTNSSIVLFHDNADTTVKSETERIVWLLAFPQSGAQMVMKNIVQISGHSGATVHGQQLGENAIPVLPGVEGSPVQLNPNYPVPYYILTRNHCDGGCVSCLPMESSVVFDRVCHTTTVMINGTANHTQYADNITKASLTLVRNPFDVIRSRMNRGFIERKQEFGLTDAKVEELIDSHAGLLQWCRRLDDEYELADSLPRNRTEPSLFARTQRSFNSYRNAITRFVHRCNKVMDCPSMELWPEQKFKFLGQYLKVSHQPVEFELSDDVKQRYRDLPCYSEWLRYIQWYNYALQLSRPMKRERILYFEDIVEHRHRTYADLVRSLNLPEAGHPAGFKPQRAQHKLIYTPEQARMASQLVIELASPQLWPVLRRYFVREQWFNEINLKLLDGVIALL